VSKEHLIPFTKETAKENGSKGGKASGKARRRKRDMKQAMNMLLSLPVNEKNREKLEMLGIDPDEADNQMLMLTVAMQEALKGNMRAIEYITDLTTVNATNKTKFSIERERNKIMKDTKIKNDDSEKDQLEKLDDILKGIDEVAKK
jgi:hypothetical protein